MDEKTEHKACCVLLKEQLNAAQEQLDAAKEDIHKGNVRILELQEELRGVYEEHMRWRTAISISPKSMTPKSVTPKAMTPRAVATTIRLTLPTLFLSKPGSITTS